MRRDKAEVKEEGQDVHRVQVMFALTLINMDFINDYVNKNVIRVFTNSLLTILNQ
jgi:hypothetical protein